MYDRVNLSDLKLHENTIADGRVRAVGYELRPKQMRPSVWVFEPGEQSTKHYQEEQEELYHVLSGRFEMTFSDDEGDETETLTLESGDVVVVSPDEVRQLTCLDAGEVFIVGAPNTKDDGVVVD
ncbi:cupin domain-containing protein [Haloferax sp. MBLA0076]|uniref:Cupin domain-containing protein n=1 Tax=Haloferax litoreum TaxID=2666140 RepID=A0A6A8GLD5_9EURY|nr:MULTISPECIES: cupin domain-containing protein [Haloferax]KAB1189859.1 cupin domain-containing protein [Haloferax sp. CBA1148]MRX23621.1 cupin domain-containing protein [Haloferax litoreum]